MKKLYEESAIQDIANAIREKNGGSATYKVAQMGAAVRAITGGGGGSSDDGLAKVLDKTVVSVDVPRATSKIGSYAFYACTMLESVTIPGTVESIGYHAFASCSVLTNVFIEEGVKTIGNSSFYYCKALKNIELPESITEIQSYAFSNCHSLETIKLKSKVPPSLESNGSPLGPDTCKILVPAEALDAYSTAFNWKSYADRMEGY